ncbi:MAG: hypothetical protein R2735_08750 [Microthrixaceae bacterium]
MRCVAAVGMVLWIPVIRAANGHPTILGLLVTAQHMTMRRTRLRPGSAGGAERLMVRLHAVHALVLPRAVMRMDSGVAWGIVEVTTVILVAATAYLLYLPHAQTRSYRPALVTIASRKDWFMASAPNMASARNIASRRQFPTPTRQTVVERACQRPLRPQQPR